MSNLVSNDAIVAAFRTMVVPMKLPPEPDCPDSIFQYLTEQVVQNKSLHKPNDATWMLAHYFCQLHQTRYFSAKNIQKTLTSIAPGGVRAFYLAAQNAVLMLHRLSLDPDLVEVYAWAAQLPPDEVLGAVKEPLRYRIPESAVRVKYSLLSDTIAFSELLYDLGVNEQPEALPKTFRAGDDVLEERGTINPMFVTEWLVRAVDGESICTEQERANALLKKVRDEARYGMGKLLWRRCPIWFALKSALHLATRLTMPDRESAHADLSYKLWVTDVLATLYTSNPATGVKHYYSNLEEQCGRSAILEGTRRLARRVEKLKQKPEYSGDTWASLNGDEVQMRCELAIEHAIDYLRGIEGGNDPVWTRVRLSERDVQNGLVHKMANGWAAVQRLKKIVDNGYDQGSLSIQDPPAIHRHRNLDILKPPHAKILADALSSAMKENAPRKIIAALCDVRDNVIQKWKSIQRQREISIYDDTSEGLLQLLRINLEVSARFGKNDVRIESLNTILISLTIVLLLDQINCALFPLLSEHKLGLPVNSDQFLNQLCLAQRSEKEHLSSLEKYILSRNKAPGAVFVSGRWADGSFQTKFAKSCPQMRAVHSKIQAQCLQNEHDKLAEYRRLRSHYDDCANRVNSSSCQCYCNDRGYKVTSDCKKCNWEQEMRGINVCFYERLLPPREIDQWAVVYELAEPSNFSCLREAIYLLATKILDNPATISTPSGGTIYHWKEDSELNQWNVSRTSPLRLSSMAKKFCQSHYRCQHVTSHGSFVVDCAKNCIQSRRASFNGESFMNNIDSWSWSVERKCTVQLEQPRYQALQKFVGGWNHNENQVLCDKSEAHRDRKVASANIPLTEFEAIGRLRAGHSLQIERFLECMSQRSVSFREMDVVMAAMALFWQAAPNSADEWWRDTWQRIASVAGKSNLAVDCARHAQELLHDARENWDSHNVLLVITVFLRMTFEHIPSSGQKAQAKVAKVLRFAREVALEWVEKINEATNRCTKEDDTQHLLAKIAAVASIGVLTFLPHDRLMVHGDLADFLHLRATARDNQSVQALRQHSWQRQFDIYAEAAAEAVVNRCHALIAKNPECLDEFLRLHWGRARSATFHTDWQRYSDGAASDSWYYSDYVDRSQSCRVDIDLLGGLFLIDGRPCQRLPESITSHTVYTRLFGPSVFSVQPDGSGGFCTQSIVEGATYSFRDGEVPHIEEERDGVRSVLVPNASFAHPSPQSTNDFPKTLIEDYSHWITRGSSKLYFRPKCYTDKHFKSFSPAHNTSADYILDLNTRMVEVVQRNELYLLDIASQAHQSLFENIFHRVCIQPDLHVFAPRGKMPSCVLAEVCLPRMQNLQFNVMEANQLGSFNPIGSTDYQGLCVAEDQNCGTLLGLKHGLLLTGTRNSNSQYERRVLIMPHGKVKRVSRKHTAVDVDRLREPSFFKYDIRDDIHDIHPPKPRHATTFLALLHATTSRLFPDPFLGCTGTQKAIALLQSGRCCGNLTTSMDEDASDILQREAITLTDIAKLSPAREFYPSHLRVMETVQWPLWIEPLCAHSSFAFLAMFRVNDMENALALVGRRLETTPTTKEVIQQRTGELSKRAIVTSSLSLYPMDCNMDSAEFGRVFGTEDVLCEWLTGQGKHFNVMKGFDTDALAATSMVGHCGHISETGLTECGLIKGLLQHSLSLQSLQGWMPNREGLQTGEVSQWASLISKPTMDEETRKQHTDFRNIWISLYNIARKKVIRRSPNGQMQFALLLSFLAQRYPGHRDLLLQLLFISRNGLTFKEINPPEYSDYCCPADDQYDESVIEKKVEDALEGFGESSPSRYARNYTTLRRDWEQRRNAHCASCQASKHEIINNAKRAWNGRRVLRDHEVHYENVSCPPHLMESINTHLTNWKKSEELSLFIDRVAKALSKCQRRAVLYPLSKIEGNISKRD